MIDPGDKFYIGRALDPSTMEEREREILYDPDDLTTHGVVVGMTGSGKTGLSIDILEEAALQGIPALIVDPKGDLTNLLLHFPDLRAQDFQPWVDANEARREGLTVPELAAETARTWREGLQDWGILPERIRQVQNSVQYRLYSPGSQAATPVDILGSLAPPAGSWEREQERYRDAISGTTTSLLGLVGIESDPVQSREHILLASLLEEAWKEGGALTLAELIRRVQSPPMDQLGAIDLETFYPADARSDLAIQLNGLLASPSFAAWTAGDPLDVEAMLWTPDGKPSHTIFYLAHLPDSERMFFLTLLLTALEAWMRGQQGSQSLRALFYMDEVLGYLPPVSEPPSKAPFLRLLKQARAYGIGLLLATQNPVDLDYKALSNAGTWFIGRLQTAQDKARLLDGLASAEAGRGLDLKDADELISKLGKRAFLLHNVHADRPEVFRTRWAMAYLRGPISSAQLGQLAQFTLVKPADPAQSGASREQTPSPVSKTKPAVPRGLDELYLLTDPPADEPHFHPGLVAHASVRFVDRKSGVNHVEDSVYLVREPDPRGRIAWEGHRLVETGIDQFAREYGGAARYEDLDEPLNDARLMRSIRSDLEDHLYHEMRLVVSASQELELVSQPGMTPQEFQQIVERAADEAFEKEARELQEKYSSKIERIKKKIARETRDLSEEKSELTGRRLEEMATHAENLLGLFGGSRSRRRVTSSLTKRRLTSQARADLEESQALLEEYEGDLADLQAEMQEELEALQERWDTLAAQVTDLEISPYKKDIHVQAFGVVWLAERVQPE